MAPIIPLRDIPPQRQVLPVLTDPATPQPDPASGQDLSEFFANYEAQQSGGAGSQIVQTPEGDVVYQGITADEAAQLQILAEQTGNQSTIDQLRLSLQRGQRIDLSPVISQIRLRDGQYQGQLPEALKQAIEKGGVKPLSPEELPILLGVGALTVAGEAGISTQQLPKSSIEKIQAQLEGGAPLPVVTEEFISGKERVRSIEEQGKRLKEITDRVNQIYSTDPSLQKDLETLEFLPDEEKEAFISQNDLVNRFETLQSRLSSEGIDIEKISKEAEQYNLDRQTITTPLSLAEGSAKVPLAVGATAQATLEAFALRKIGAPKGFFDVPKVGSKLSGKLSWLTKSKLGQVAGPATFLTLSGVPAIQEYQTTGLTGAVSGITGRIIGFGGVRGAVGAIKRYSQPIIVERALGQPKFISLIVNDPKLKSFVAKKIPGGLSILKKETGIAITRSTTPMIRQKYSRKLYDFESGEKDLLNYFKDRRMVSSKVYDDVTWMVGTTKELKGGIPYVLPKRQAKVFEKTLLEKSRPEDIRYFKSSFVGKTGEKLRKIKGTSLVTDISSEVPSYSLLKGKDLTEVAGGELITGRGIARVKTSKTQTTGKFTFGAGNKRELGEFLGKPRISYSTNVEFVPLYKKQPPTLSKGKVVIWGTPGDEAKEIFRLQLIAKQIPKIVPAVVKPTVAQTKTKNIVLGTKSKLAVEPIQEVISIKPKVEYIPEKWKGVYDVQQELGGPLTLTGGKSLRRQQDTQLGLSIDLTRDLTRDKSREKTQQRRITSQDQLFLPAQTFRFKEAVIKKQARRARFIPRQARKLKSVSKIKPARLRVPKPRITTRRKSGIPPYTQKVMNPLIAGKGKRTRSKAFVPVVRRRGKWLPVGGATTKGRALLRGARVTRGTLAASFKVVPTSSTVVGRDIKFTPPRKVFRKPKIRGVEIKSPVFVQRGGRERAFVPGRRLATRGERREIQFLRRSKR